MRIECGVTTEKGPVRSRNEDNYLIGNQSLLGGAYRGSDQRAVITPCVFAVCDGMGGRGHGQYAAQTAVKSLSEYGSRLDGVLTSALMNHIKTLIQKVNLEVVALNHKGVKGGTTLAFAYLSQEQIYLANVGDSRIYQYRNGKLSRISVDHNQFQELLELSIVNANNNSHKGANELTQFLGIDPEEFIIEPHYVRLDYSDMLLLLCSDGLTSSVSEERISQILDNPLGETMEQVSKRLVEQALKNGSKDDVTAMVVKIKLESIKGSTGMNNFNPRIFEPFWESWYIDSLIGEGSFGYVYKIYKEAFGKKYYSALKIISLPKSEAEAKEILYESSDQETATRYFREIAEVIYKEIQIMEELKGKTNIVSFEDHKIIQKEDGVGYYILIRMELLTCLNDYLTRNSLTTRMLHNLAMDVCRALQLCQRRNIIHRDIKPANIFVSADGDFKLGDFGIARQLEGLESGLSIKGTYSYMAPEVYMGNPYDNRADIYSLGMVLYYFLNRKHAPFTNLNSTIQRYGEKQEALKRRFLGEELPDPITGTKAFIQVVKKACSYKPEDRYTSADDFLEALMSIKEFDDEIIIDTPKGIRKEDTLTRLKADTFKAEDTSSKQDVFNKQDVSSKQDAPSKEDLFKIEELSKEEINIEEINKEEIKKEEFSKEEFSKEDVFNKEEFNKEDVVTKEVIFNNEDTSNKEVAWNRSNSVVSSIASDDLVKPSVSFNNDYSVIDTNLMKEVPFKENAGIEIKTEESALEDEIINDEDEATVLLSSANHMGDLSQVDKSTKKRKYKVAVTSVAFLAITVIVAFIMVFSQLKSDKEVGIETIAKQWKEMISVVEQEKQEAKAPAKVVEEAVPEVIEEYIVEQNNQGYTDYSGIDKLEKVTSLTLANNKLTTTAGLSVAIHLTYLNLEINMIEELSGIDKLTKLEFLNLNGNQISDLSNIKTIESLNTLILSDNKITDISALAKLVHLRELRLDGNTKLIDVNVIKNLKDLQVLELSNTSVEDITCLYELKNLCIVNLQHTLVDKKQVKELKKKLPDCTVIQ